MIIRFSHQNEEYLSDLSAPIDISIPMHSGLQNPNAFNIPPPRFEPIVVGDFVGSVLQGSGANCENLSLNAHGNGTHTECIGHITRRRITINESLKIFHFLGRLITLTPRLQPNGDRMLMAADLGGLVPEGTEALLIRTLPNLLEKVTEMYSGNNPPFLEPEFCRQLAVLGVKHLLVDLPSVDREEDKGTMLAHKAFWHYPERPRYEATISEMIYVPNHVLDGTYLLNLQIASLETDASPSKPVLYRIKHV